MASVVIIGAGAATLAPEAGRILLGSVNVVTSVGVQVGRGDVVVQNVTP